MKKAITSVRNGELALRGAHLAYTVPNNTLKDIF